MCLMQKALRPAASGFVFEVEGLFDLYLGVQYFSGKKSSRWFQCPFFNRFYFPSQSYEVYSIL
jgi:hypothetical protein